MNYALAEVPVCGNGGIDFGEFAKFWSSLHGASDALIREEFYKIDLDKSGYITKGSFLVFMFGKVLFIEVEISF